MAADLYDKWAFQKIPKEVSYTSQALRKRPNFLNSKSFLQL